MNKETANSIVLHLLHNAMFQDAQSMKSAEEDNTLPDSVKALLFKINKERIEELLEAKICLFPELDNPEEGAKL